MWYLAQLTGGHRTMFCGCGMAGSFDLEVFTSMSVESLRASAPVCPVCSWVLSSCSGSARPASVGANTLPGNWAAWACCSWMARAKLAGSETAADLSSARALRSRLLFSRCSCKRDMAERRAMASGFSLSDMATEGGCWRKVATGGGAGREGASVRSIGASWATEAVGVMGDTGGRLGEADSERLRERSDVDEASLDEAGRWFAVVFVSTRSAGMAAATRSTFLRQRAQESSQKARGSWMGRPEVREMGVADCLAAVSSRGAARGGGAVAVLGWACPCQMR